MEERKKRYKEKINIVRENIEKLEEWLPESETDEKSFMASAKTFQELAEALMDIFAMLVKDFNYIPKDDYSNIEQLKTKKFLNEEEAKVCSEANGLRNVVVHKYNSIDKNLFVESASTLAPNIKKITNKVESFIQKWKNLQKQKK